MRYLSWISIHDVVGALYECAGQSDLEGPVNLTAPHPTTNREFVKTLGRVLSRPTFIPAPAFGLKIAFGEMANETILGSQRVTPSKLVQSGYPFLHQDLEETLRFELGRASNETLSASK